MRTISDVFDLTINNIGIYFSKEADAPSRLSFSYVYRKTNNKAATFTYHFNYFRNKDASYTLVIESSNETVQDTYEKAVSLELGVVKELLRKMKIYVTNNSNCKDSDSAQKWEFTISDVQVSNLIELFISSKVDLGLRQSMEEDKIARQKREEERMKNSPFSVLSELKGKVPKYNRK